MSFPKKKSRRIVIENHPFRWMIKVGYHEVVLLIISEEHNGRRLFANFRHNVNGKDACMYDNPFIVEPSLVRKTILFGIAKGYAADEKGNDMNLGDLSDELVLN